MSTRQKPIRRRIILTLLAEVERLHAVELAAENLLDAPAYEGDIMRHELAKALKKVTP